MLFVCPVEALLTSQLKSSTTELNCKCISTINESTSPAKDWTLVTYQVHASRAVHCSIFNACALKSPCMPDELSEQAASFLWPLMNCVEGKTVHVMLDISYDLRFLPHVVPAQEVFDVYHGVVMHHICHL